MSRHFCYEDDPCEVCSMFPPLSEREPIVWQWWIAVPAAWMRRKLRL